MKSAVDSHCESKRRTGWDCVVDVMPKDVPLDDSLGVEILGVLPPHYDTTFTKDCRSVNESWHTAPVAPGHFPSENRVCSRKRAMVGFARAAAHCGIKDEPTA